MQYALITGAGSGLGRAFSIQLAREGWYVGVTDIDLDAAEETLRLIEQEGGRGIAAMLDVTDFESWQTLLAQLRESWPQLDLLINNAGVCAAGELGTAPIKDFERVFQVNLLGTLYGCQSMVPWLIENPNRGHIINVSSIFGFVAAPSMGAYCTSKAGVVALSETLYGELSPFGIGVTVVAPSFFPTKLIDNGLFPNDVQRDIAEAYTKKSSISPASVVAKTFKAVQKKRLYVVIGWKANLYWRLKRLFPTTVTRIAKWRHGKQMQKFEGTSSAP